MTKMVKITCDNCEKDITDTGAMPTYRLLLRAEALPHVDTDVVYAVMVYPPLDRDHHFCDQTCLRDWLAAKPSSGRPDGSLAYS